VGGEALAALVSISLLEDAMVRWRLLVLLELLHRGTAILGVDTTPFSLFSR
jgi:hypothetical protein